MSICLAFPGARIASSNLILRPPTKKTASPLVPHLTCRVGEQLTEGGRHFSGSVFASCGKLCAQILGAQISCINLGLRETLQRSPMVVMLERYSC